MQTTTLNIIDTEVGTLLVISGLEQKEDSWEAFATDIHANPYVLTYTTTSPIELTQPDSINILNGFCTDKIYFAKRDGAETLKQYLFENLRKGASVYRRDGEHITKIEVVKRANGGIYFSDGNRYINKKFVVATGTNPRYLLDSQTSRELYEAYTLKCAEWGKQLEQHKAEIIQAVAQKPLTKEQVAKIITTLNEN